MNNFRFIGAVDISELMKEVDGASLLWNQNTLRTKHAGTCHADVSDIWIRYPDLSRNSENPIGIIDDLACIDYPAIDSLPSLPKIISEVMSLVNGSELGRVLITSLKPGGKILPHDDAGEAAKYYERYHVSLQSFEGNIFRAGDEFVFMKPGELWWFDNLKEHELVNGSEKARIHLLLDIRGAQ